MIDAGHECLRCGDPGPPVTVTVPLNPDAPSWDTWSVELWQCRVCLHRYSRAAVVSKRLRVQWRTGPLFAPRVRVRTIDVNPEFL